MRATWFEIPVRDLAAARRFYEHVFEVVLVVEVVDGVSLAVFPAGGGEAGSPGALACGDTYVPSADGTRVYLEVADVAATLGRAERAGGRRLYPVTEVREGMRVAEFADPEGNRVALIGP